MEAQQAERAFAAMMAGAKRLWGDQLTEEMVDGAKNNAERLVHALQEKLGTTREAIERGLNSLKD